MGKPIVFFSHSSKDAEVLARLKARFVELTGGTIEVFLSSDGQSIRFGKNWVSSIEDALKEAKLMFVFLTPNSVGSSWIYFEAGHAYSKTTDVVPVGLFGVDVGKIPPPLSLLQGFNLTDHETLNNLIKITNETFNYAHKPAFEPADFRTLPGRQATEASRLLGKHSSAIDSVQLSRTLGKGEETLNAVRSLLATAVKDGDHLKESIDSYLVPSAVFSIDGQSLMADIDPRLVHVALPHAERVLGTVSRYAASEISPLAIVFEASVRAETQAHKIMAAVHGREVEPHEFVHRGKFRYRELLFSLDYPLSPGRKTGPVLWVEKSRDSFTDEPLAELLDLLFECEVFTYKEPLPPWGTWG